MPDKKHCYICGVEYKDSILSKAGSSNFCLLCRRITDKAVLYAISSLVQQINNIAKRVAHFHKKEIEAEMKRLAKEGRGEKPDTSKPKGL